MKETPILMSTPMVLAYLEGRKTMTRRAIKPQPFEGSSGLEWEYRRGRFLSEVCLPKTTYRRNEFLNDMAASSCPYGQVGDILWWKEALVRSDKGTPTRYAADGCPVMRDGESIDWPFKKSTLPSIFMPRWASRITTPITGLRVERLQEITAEDCKAEGISLSDMGIAIQEGFPAIAAFADYWDSLNAKKGHSWATNEWVFVIEFPKRKSAV